MPLIWFVYGEIYFFFFTKHYNEKVPRYCTYKFSFSIYSFHVIALKLSICICRVRYIETTSCTSKLLFVRIICHRHFLSSSQVRSDDALFRSTRIFFFVFLFIRAIFLSSPPLPIEIIILSYVLLYISVTKARSTFDSFVWERQLYSVSLDRSHEIHSAQFGRVFIRCKFQIFFFFFLVYGSYWKK